MTRRVLATALLAAALVVPAGAEDGLEAARRYREAHAAEILRDFAALLSIPNVASDGPNIRRNAELLRGRLQAAGARAELLELDGAAPPVVWGRLDGAAGGRTLGLYIHYDGQPVEPSEWRHDPWTPTLYTRAMEAGGEPRPLPEAGEPVDPEWRLYARAAGDDKAPLTALFAALAALREAGIRPTSNLVFFFEGEEEAGSPHLRSYLERYRDRLADVDLWLFLDGPSHPSGRPQIAYGVRGMTELELTVYGPLRPLHSGHYGNWAPVPGRLLAELLASFYDQRGQVAVQGFYDSVEPLGAAERQALARLPNDDDRLRRELGLAAVEGGGQTLAERLLLPSLTIQGMASGSVGDRAQNVIPPEARANLGIRLVKGNDPERMLDLVEAHIERQGFHLVRQEPDLATRLAHPKLARAERLGGYPAARTPMDLPLGAALTAAAARASGQEPVLLPGMGGSLPLYLFNDFLGQPCLIVPVANADNRQHAANENLRLANLWYAIDLYGALLTLP